MPENKLHWDKQAIRDAEIRHTEKTVTASVSPGTRWHIQGKLNKQIGYAYVNVHPFVNAIAAVEAVAEMFTRLEDERRAAAKTPGWKPGSEYAWMFTRNVDRDAVGTVSEAGGLGIDHERYAVHKENRPPAAPHLDRELFVHVIEPDRPLGAPAIDEVIEQLVGDAALEGMTNGRHRVAAA